MLRAMLIGLFLVSCVLIYPAQSFSEGDRAVSNYEMISNFFDMVAPAYGPRQGEEQEAISRLDSVSFTIEVDKQQGGGRTLRAVVISPQLPKKMLCTLELSKTVSGNASSISRTLECE